MKKPLLIANWKLNHSKKSAQEFFTTLCAELPHALPVDVVVAPVAVLLDACVQFVGSNPVSIAAQNVFYEKKGAFTGEWSADHLAELGVGYALIGHSERRHLFFESDQDVSKKMRACLDAKVIPVVCVGESLSERDAGKLFSVLKRQCDAVLKNLHDHETIVFAYEPVWAIGTGRSASAEEAQEAHRIIRTIAGDHAHKILYGGSVTPENIGTIGAMPDVDGALVGGASLQVASFLSMVKELTRVSCR